MNNINWTHPDDDEVNAQLLADCKAMVPTFTSLLQKLNEDPSEANFQNLIDSHITLCDLMSLDEQGPSNDLRDAVEEAMHYAIEEGFFTHFQWNDADPDAAFEGTEYFRFFEKINPTQMSNAEA